MKKFGFWNEEEGQASLPEQLITQEAKLSKELHELLEKQRRYQNREKALQEMRTARMQKSRETIAENKKIRQEKTEVKAKLWQDTKKSDITFLGEDVSKGLNQITDGNLEKLKEKNLPLIQTAEDLAQLMKTDIKTIRFLSYNRTVSNVSHYKKFQIPKKAGGFRNISAPMPKLKEAQHWILENLLNKLPVHINAHGFALEKSIASNARPHIKKEVLINIDLKDFFPSVHYPRVKGMFRSLGYNEKISTILALICTESETDEVELDGKKYYVKSGNRALPQGAPTSPAITNYLCRRMDARFTGLGKKYNFEYTRYADDLTFSCTTYNADEFKKFLGFVKKTIKSENFTIHPDKFKVLRKNSKQEVTGIVVNEKLSVERKKIKKFRATLYQVEKNGLEGRNWNYSPNFLASLKGYANFINQVDPIKGKLYVERVNKILITHNFKHEIIFKAKPKVVSLPENTKIDKPKKPWWKFW
ncbi:MAG: reverse transcriptase family protein [Bacteroidota bacterium]